MSRTLLTTANNEELLRSQQKELDAKKSAYELHLKKIRQSDIKIKKTIQIILNSELDIKSQTKLINSIEQLEIVLSLETDNALKEKKYQSLSKMLTIVTSNKVTIAEKNSAMESFLSQIAVPSSQINHDVTSAILIAGVILIIGIGLIISNVLIPLIPITAALAGIGLTGAALSTTCIGINFVTTALSVTLLTYISLKVAEFIIEPISYFYQQYSNEYVVAAKIDKCLSGFKSEECILSGSDADEENISLLTLTV